MLTLENIESELSYAYLHAVASRCGLSCAISNRHADAAGIDATLQAFGKIDPSRSILDSVSVDIQLKATRVPPTEIDGRYSFSLPIKNYDELRSKRRHAPQLLIALFLPTDPTTWLEQDEEKLIARRCAYWVSLRGAPASSNLSHQTVYIPRKNVLNADGLRALMILFSRREHLDYDS